MIKLDNGRFLYSPLQDYLEGVAGCKKFQKSEVNNTYVLKVGWFSCPVNKVNPLLPLIYFATPGLAVSPTLCCSWCLSFGGILTPAVIGESKCDIIRNSFHC